MLTIAYASTTYKFPNLTDHPLAYSGELVERGRSVRQWNVTGLVSPADAATFEGIFRSWRAAKLLEDDMARTASIGATVALTGTAPGFTWSTPVACHFIGAPQFQAAGAYVRLSAALEDANERLAVILRGLEEEAEQFATLGLGTLTFGTAVVNLTADPDDFGDLPQATLTPGGKHFLSGPLSVTEVRNVQGWVTAANLTNLETWLKTTTSTTPTPGTWFPTGWTQPTVLRRPDAGVMATYYNVSFTVVKFK